MSVHQRVRSVDALRGLAIGGMIFVNSAGAPVWPQLAHRPWNGMTAADVVFPVFVFALGASLALQEPPGLLRVARRAVVLVGLGLAINALLYGSPLRVPGVLQRLAFVYVLAAVVVRAPRVAVAILAGVLLVAHGLGLAEFGMSVHDSLAARVDVELFGAPHLLDRVGFDPEGLVGSVAATATALLGYLSVAALVRADRVGRSAARVAVVAAGAIFVGVWAGDIVPINKQLWSPTFVLVTAGIAALLLVLLIPVDHVRLLAFAAKPLVVIGANALLVFVLAELVQVGLRRMITVDGACGPAPCRLVDAHTWLFERVFEPLAGERLGSLAFSGAILVTMWIIAAVLWRARLFVRASLARAWLRRFVGACRGRLR